jgi:hypothetical protein
MISRRKTTCPTTSNMKRFSGNPLKKPNSIGVKKEE